MRSMPRRTAGATASSRRRTAPAHRAGCPSPSRPERHVIGGTHARASSRASPSLFWGFEGLRRGWPGQARPTVTLQRTQPQCGGAALFNLGFAEDDVLARHRIELLELELIRLGPWVLLRHIETAGIGAADELDQDGAGFRHGGSRGFGFSAVSKIACGRPLSRRARADRPGRDCAPPERPPAEHAARSRKAADRTADAPPA